MRFRNISFKAPDVYHCALDIAVRAGKYPSKSELIREAIRYFLKEKMGIIIDEYNNTMEYEEGGEKKRIKC